MFFIVRTGVARHDSRAPAEGCGQDQSHARCEKYGAGYKVRTRDPLITNSVLNIYLEFPYIP
jgi:hypothetical protein